LTDGRDPKKGTAGRFERRSHNTKRKERDTITPYRLSLQREERLVRRQSRKHRTQEPSLKIPANLAGLPGWPILGSRKNLTLNGSFFGKAAEVMHSQTMTEEIARRSKDRGKTSSGKKNPLGRSRGGSSNGSRNKIGRPSKRGGRGNPTLMKNRLVKTMIPRASKRREINGRRN